MARATTKGSAVSIALITQFRRASNDQVDPGGGVAIVDFSSRDRVFRFSVSTLGSDPIEPGNTSPFRPGLRSGGSKP